MNKETIYIEPSDDITDILSKLKASDKKVVALVPSKKPTVLLSSVNIKLVARTAKSEKKAVVLVTTDDSLTKLAMAANLPVAPSLKSRPVIPGEENAPEEKPQRPEEPKPSEEKEDVKVKDPEPEEETVAENSDPEDEDDSDDDDDEEEPKKEKKAKKEKKKSEKSGFTGWISDHKPVVIFSSVGLVALIAFLVWALVIAPSVKVSVSVRTTSSNFSENVSFTKNSADEDSTAGKFYVHEEKLEKDQAVKFTATGRKDMGEAASGEVRAVYYFTATNGASVTIDGSTTISHNGLNFTPTSSVVLAGPNGTSPKTLKETCDNYSEDLDMSPTGIAAGNYCQVSVSVPVKASAPGEDYNISATSEGWTASISGLTIVSRTDISGGTSRVVTVVQQSDVDLALDKLKSESSSDGKNELMAKLGNSTLPIESSYKVSTEDPKVTPAVGEEVKDGVTPQVSTKTTYVILTADSVRIEEFIKKKANLESGKRLYSVGDPFIEYFSEGSDGVYSAKLKTTYKVGPEISETEILEKIQGEKIGRLEPILKDAFSGVSSVKTEKSYFWVNSVPSAPNKVKVELTVEE
ncbi:hypothetical protein IKE71_00455 [Candidatus Saccharibacteria bacterium]|nr:hypothetical protein [Candidatus Saccharibacteria bacterium]